MIRTVIHINEKLCSGCGLCASACKEGAIAMVNGKARLIRDDYCDGLGIANQLLAKSADEVYFMVAGLPLTVKKG